MVSRAMFVRHESNKEHRSSTDISSLSKRKGFTQPCEYRLSLHATNFGMFSWKSPEVCRRSGASDVQR